ncbi:unnamed protein product [Rhizophagus irregularis]|nr:unnamed protein product [Rhizophagus irregularis]
MEGGIKPRDERGPGGNIVEGGRKTRWHKMGISELQGSEGPSESGRKGETIDNGSDKRCSSDKKEIFRSGQ